MYIGYLNDRKELGFSCIKDTDAVKELSDFKNTLKNPVTWIITKGKKTLILIFSKEVLVAVFIFLESRYIEPNVDWSSFSSSQVYQSCVIKSDTSGFLTSPSHIQDYILKSRGGVEFTDEQQDKLANSILAKTPESDLDDISINKLLQKLLEIIDPVISNQKLWRILSELEKPSKPQLSDGNHISSTDNCSRAQNVQNKQPKSKGSSSIFAESLPIPTPRKLSPMQTRVQLKMAQKNLQSSGLSCNHEQLSEKIQVIEKLTRLRRAQPLYSSEVLGDSFKYSQQQLERKAPRHLTNDYNISIEGKTKTQQGLVYFHEVEEMLKTPNLIVREDGIMNQQEPAIICFDPDSKLFASFENNPLYEDHHFISSYEIDDDAVKEFIMTGNIGENPQMRKAKIDQDQKLKAAQERMRENANSFYQTLPQDARIGNKQLREAEALKHKLKEDPKFQLTEKEKTMIQRAEKYQQYKNQYYQKNPEIDKDEL